MIKVEIHILYTQSNMNVANIFLFQFTTRSQDCVGHIDLEIVITIVDYKETMMERL